MCPQWHYSEGHPNCRAVPCPSQSPKGVKGKIPKCHYPWSSRICQQSLSFLWRKRIRRSIICVFLSQQPVLNGQYSFPSIVIINPNIHTINPHIYSLSNIIINPNIYYNQLNIYSLRWHNCHRSLRESRQSNNHKHHHYDKLHPFIPNPPTPCSTHISVQDCQQVGKRGNISTSCWQ